MTTLIERLRPSATNHRNAIASLATFVEKVRLSIAAQRSADSQPPKPTYVGTPAHLLATDTERERLFKTGQALYAEVKRKWDEIHALTLGYEELLYKMALIYRVALYDAFIPDALLAVVLTEPRLMKSDNTLTHREVIDHTASGSLIDYIATKMIRPFSYLSTNDQSKWVKKRLSIDLCSSPAELEELTEIVARRNLFAHANGIVNEEYKKLVPKSTSSVGDQLTVDYAYWYRANIALKESCDKFLAELTKKFCPGEPLPDYLGFSV
jgi:hypothetical protein